METITENPQVSMQNIRNLDSPVNLANDETLQKDKVENKTDNKKRPYLNMDRQTKSRSDITIDEIKQMETFFVSNKTEKETDIDDGNDNYDDQLKKDKLLVYAHPLFPLLALIFEKCELATNSLNAFETDASLKSCDAEIVAFIEQHQKSGIPLFTDRPEVDSLMIRSIQVFRIHLLELEKVSDLCTDFCARYTNCLKEKMRSDILLRGTSLDNHQHQSTSGDNIDADGDEDCCLLDRTNNDLHSSSSVSSCDVDDDKINPFAAIKAEKRCANDNVINNNNDSNKNENNNYELLTSSQQAMFNISFSFSSPSSSPSCSLSSPKSGSTSPSGSEVSSHFSPQHDTDSSLSGQNAQDPCPIPILNSHNFSIEHLLSLNDLKMRTDGSLPINFAELLQTQITLSNAGLVGSTNPMTLPFSEALPNFRPTETSSAVDLTIKKVKRQTNYTKPENEIQNIKSAQVVNGKEKSRSSKKFAELKRDKTSKRGILPKHATAIMRTWLFQHIVHPYPTEDEKRAIAAETKLTMLQVNNWFINARRRILQPMLDSANTLQSELCKSSLVTGESQQPEVSNTEQNTQTLPTGRTSESSKKLKSEHNSKQLANGKIWSQSLANILQTGADLNG